MLPGKVGNLKGPKTSVMKPIAATGLLMLLASAASAQFSILPQVGMERTRTSVNYDHLGSVTPLGTKTGLSASLRFDYRFRGGHGPFAGIATSPGVMVWSFSNPSAALSSPKNTGPLQWRLEAGYQYSSRPLALGNRSAKASSSKSGNNKGFGCGAGRRPLKQPVLHMRIQPSVAFAWLLGARQDLSTKGGGYVYRAGNFNKAIVPGMAVELGRGRERLVNLGFYYTLPLVSDQTVRITSVQNGKPVTTSFSSAQHSWSLRIGLPVSLVTHKKPVTRQQQKKDCSSRCGSYRIHCVQKL